MLWKHFITCKRADPLTNHSGQQAYLSGLCQCVRTKTQHEHAACGTSDVMALLLYRAFSSKALRTTVVHECSSSHWWASLQILVRGKVIRRQAQLLLQPAAPEGAAAASDGGAGVRGLATVMETCIAAAVADHILCQHCRYTNAGEHLMSKEKVRWVRVSYAVRRRNNPRCAFLLHGRVTCYVQCSVHGWHGPAGSCINQARQAHISQRTCKKHAYAAMPSYKHSSHSHCCQHHNAHVVHALVRATSQPTQAPITKPTAHTPLHSTTNPTHVTSTHPTNTSQDATHCSEYLDACCCCKGSGAGHAAGLLGVVGHGPCSNRTSTQGLDQGSSLKSTAVGPGTGQLCWPVLAPLLPCPLQQLLSVLAAASAHSRISV